MILLIGGDGELGAATAERLRRDGHSVIATTRRSELIAWDRPFLDLADSLEDWEPPPETQAACILAAVARLAACDNDPRLSARINVTQTVTLCERLIAHGIYVLFLSSNQVFDGNTPQMAPNAMCAPVSEYGRQKAQTEATLSVYVNRGAAAILRLAKVVSQEMPLIRDWIIKLRAGEGIRAFDDMTLAPTPLNVAVSAIVRLLIDNARGIFQLSGPRDITYAELAGYLADRVGGDRQLVEPISARALGFPIGGTPRYTTLDSSLLRDRYGIAVPGPWQVVDEIIGSVSAHNAASQV